MERTGGFYPGLMLQLDASCNERVGGCWMAGRLRDGDIAMVIRQSGDCFWYMRLLQRAGKLASHEYRNGYKLLDGSEFGAYVCGKPFEYQPTTREFHLLMAGETIFLSAEPKP